MSGIAMINEAQGSLLEAQAEALVNTVNCVGVMGKGIALQFKQAYPQNFREYARACRKNLVQLGQMFTVSIGDLLDPGPTKYIINFPTKQHWRGKSRIEDIQAGLESLIIVVRDLGIRSIAVPPLGCGNGGLDWNDVRPLIESAFESVPKVQVLLYSPREAPSAEAMLIGTKVPPMNRSRALLLRLFDQYKGYGYQLSKLEAQKLAFFLQIAGEPMKLNYVKHQYGPYAENLNHVLQRLEGHYIRGYGDRSQRSEITILPGTIEATNIALASNIDAEDLLSRVSNLIEGFEYPHGMELLASVLWIAREVPTVAFDVDQVIIGMQNWNTRKRSLFSKDEIQRAWERLHEQCWLPSAVAHDSPTR